jgi:hypothetical protein
MKFQTIDYIEAGNERVARPGIFRGDELTAPVGHISFLDPRYAHQGLTLNIFYEDIDGQRRQTTIAMGKGGIRLLSHGKVF